MDQKLPKTKIYLTRRNLLSLLSKLDRKAQGEETTCSIVKNDNDHPKYSQTIARILVTAVEDEEYYVDRIPGDIHPLDIPQKSNIVLQRKSNRFCEHGYYNGHDCDICYDEYLTRLSLEKKK